jgi:hypothetical protein
MVPVPVWGQSPPRWRPREPSAAPADEDSPDALSGSDSATDRRDPVPLTYAGSDQDHQIAARFAPVFHQALGASPRFDYSRWTIDVQDSDDRVATREVTLGEIGSLFRGTVGGRNMARPPWGWYDQDETDRRQREWFLAPAETVKRHFNRRDDFLTTYLHHPAVGVLRDVSR